MEDNNIYDPMDAGTLADKFNRPDDSESRPVVIKAIGVGGGGGNAVNHMFRQEIKDVSFVVLNTDRQALEASPVPNKVLIGKGRGAGGVAQKAKDAAEADIAKIEALFEDGTCMVFITAGMGGGTGTGAAPVVARVARERGILTIGIVTIPFFFEGDRKIAAAMKGADEMQKYVDALLVINNERLTEIYGDLTFQNAFAKSDDTLSMAARSISELITGEGYINLDFEDVSTTLHDGGAAIISTGYGEGEARVSKAINDALESPLLRNRDILSAKRLLFNLYYSPDAKEEFKMSEMQYFTDFVQSIDSNVEVIWGVTFDNTLGDKVKVTILAAGFDITIREETEEIKRDIDRKKQEKPQRTTQQPGGATDNTIDRRILEEYGSQVEKYRSNYIILTPQQLDDDAVIDILEKSPAYNRDKKVLDDLKRLTQKRTAPEPAPKNPGGGISIEF